MDGTEVTGYHLQSIDSGKAGKYTRDQVCYLVGRGQVTNCTGQLYKEKVLLRGNGMSLEDLPVQQEDGTLRNAEKLGKTSKNSTVNMMEKFTIIGTIKQGRSVVGYLVQNSGMATKKLQREQVIELARNGAITNAKVQNYNGKVLLRGSNCDLGSLPTEYIEGTGKSAGSAEVTKPTTRARTSNSGTALSKCVSNIQSLSGAPVYKNLITIFCDELGEALKNTNLTVEDTEVCDSNIDVGTEIFINLKSNKSSTGGLITVIVIDADKIKVVIEKVNSKNGLTIVDSKLLSMVNNANTKGIRARFLSMGLSKLS